MTIGTPPGDTRSPLTISGVQDLRNRVGTDLGVSNWVTMDQEKVTVFARVTGDAQWIHVDPDRARQGPFGTTVAHGFLTLSLSTGLLDDVISVDNVSVVVNYGLNRVRFPSPVRVGSRMRMRVHLAEALDVPGGVQVVYHLEYEIEGEPKPGCVTDLLFRYYT